MAKVSVIVPVYNVEKYLKQCLDSIVDQTLEDLEIVLVDDGSVDSSGTICDEYAKKDSRIEVIHKINGGLSDARNVGINRANGRYIGFVDSDDYIKEDMYEKLINLIKEYDADISICNLYDVIDGKEYVRNKDNGIHEYSRIDILKEILLDKNIQSYAWNKLYKKELFDEIKYPIRKKYEDIGTTFYLFEKCNKIVVTSEPEYYYLKRADSLVNNVTESTILDYTEIIIQRYLYIKQNIKELRKYNNYYLAKTLITAHNDIENLENISEGMQQRYKKLYELVLEIIKSNSKDIDELFSEEQKSALENLIKL